MTKYAAFLRAITPTNPKMHNDKLKAVFESLGLKNVQAIISSGNVIFESDESDTRKLETILEEAFPAQLGFNSTTIIRNLEQLQDLVSKNPFGDLEHSPKTYLNVTFLKNDPETRLDFPHRPDGKPYELLALHDNAIFSIADASTAKTPDIMVWLERKYGKEITTRTWKTVNRVIAKLSN